MNRIDYCFASCYSPLCTPYMRFGLVSHGDADTADIADAELTPSMLTTTNPPVLASGFNRVLIERFQ